MATVTRVLTCVLSGAVLSCGDALVDERYAGAPRFMVEGLVTGGSEYVNENEPGVTLAVFWSPQGPKDSAAETLVEQPGSAYRAEYYREFEMPIFDEPGPEHLTRTPSGERYGIARLGAYRDENGNGRRDTTEPFLGSTHRRALLRAFTALTAEESPTQSPVPEGWHVVTTPLACGGPFPPEDTPVADGECGVPLGSPCKNDADCGGGECVHTFAEPWPGGACLIPEPPPDGCRQRGSVLLRYPGDSKAYWIPGCSESADCGRPHPYQCDLQIRGCMPSASVSLELTDKAPLPSFCLGPPLR